jgi:hypothetical protein
MRVWIANCWLEIDDLDIPMCVEFKANSWEEAEMIADKEGYELLGELDSSHVADVEALIEKRVTGATEH